jgi:cytochrome c peroxidase
MFFSKLIAKHSHATKQQIDQSNFIGSISWRTLLSVGLCSFGMLSVAGKFAISSNALAAEKVTKLPAVPFPKDNPLTDAKVLLGKQLYFDGRLSSNDQLSCATCHDPAKGYSNGEAFAVGTEGKAGGRNTPTVINTAYQDFQFWDGRAKTLEDQALGPIQNPIEMNMPLEKLIPKLNAIAGYRKQFQEVFGTDVTPDGIAKAIAAYERTVISTDAPYDKFVAGNTEALSPSAQRGMKLFFGKANCSACHSGPNFTDNAFHNIGYGNGSDIGRAEVSKLAGDKGSFKTPTLREVARSAPYMHEGGLATLEAVVEHYNKGGTPNEFLDEEMAPLNLTADEMADLVKFMVEGLSSESYPAHTAPVLP